MDLRFFFSVEVVKKQSSWARLIEKCFGKRAKKVDPGAIKIGTFNRKREIRFGQVYYNEDKKSEPDGARNIPFGSN